jgi:hypothetical protein
VRIAEQRLGSKDILLPVALPTPWTFSSAARTSLTVAASRSPIGSSARTRRAVVSKFRCACGELSDLSHDCRSCLSVSARVARSDAMRDGISG